MSDQKHIALSASRIKTLEKCSWSYWCNYVLKLPDTPNDGASRGDVVHLILEVLSHPRRKKYVNKILKKQDVFCIPSVKTLTFKRARKNKVSDPDNIESIKTMILVGLSYDFFGDRKEAPVVDVSEKEFDIIVSEKSKKYRIKGFIDRLFHYEDKSSIIRDYKTSKAVFAGKDAEDNMQHLIYTLASKKLEPEYKSLVEFLFLKFNVIESGDGVLKMPHLSEEDLENFEHQLTEIQKIVDNFSEKDARANFAADKPMPSDGSFSGRLACGFAKKKGELKKDGKPKWHCPYKFGFNYYALRDKDNKIIKTFFEDDVDQAFLIKKEAEKITRETYLGCPKYLTS